MALRLSVYVALISELCFPWPAASVLSQQPDDWGCISSLLFLAGGEGNDQFGTDI